jgi:small GTP-binding protein
MQSRRLDQDNVAAGSADPIASLFGSRGLDQVALGELKHLLALIRDQYAPLAAGRKQIALVGPVNSGKSSLYNALIVSSAPKAQVSPVPGTTRATQMGDASVFWVIDTPGANEMVVGSEGPHDSVERRRTAMVAAQQADVLVLVFDAARGIAHDEVSIYRELIALNKPFVVVLNKIDLVGNEQEAVVLAAARNLQLPVERIVPVSALRGTNLNRLLLALLETDPQLLATLAEALPNARWLLATRTILTASVAAATANLVTAPTMIPFASFIVITPIQIGMVLSLARVFGHGLTRARSKELALTFGSAILGRRVFYYLVDMLPVAGWLLGTAVAAATTMALGYGVATWFATGEKLSVETMSKLAAALTRSLSDSFRHYPDKGNLKDNIPSLITDAWKRISDVAEQYRSDTTKQPAQSQGNDKL